MLHMNRNAMRDHHMQNGMNGQMMPGMMNGTGQMQMPGMNGQMPPEMMNGNGQMQMPGMNGQMPPEMMNGNGQMDQPSPEEMYNFCTQFMQHLVQFGTNDGNVYDGIIEDVNQEGVTMLMPDGDNDDYDNNMNNNQRQYPYGYYGRYPRRFRRFRRQFFPFFLLSSLFFPYFY
ncbi:hypothetical protein BTR22_09885 [Alkalihalophilus pseudofirmus]|uniref:hypothetical protein n=1 Tax=Alkalihalophilus pseudofirmus TaxID=79885 RepID=UPI000951280F|nr:hypothetical protein BTR22_09885 [Alkalihalophilus pseudofirmus]